MGIAPSMRTIGNGAPIPPVAQTSTWRSFHRPSLATTCPIRLAWWIPVDPVQALALPLLMIMARVSPERTWLAETLTGAALILFVGKVAAATAGTLEATSARSGAALLCSWTPQQVAAAVNPSGAVTPPIISEKPKDMFGRFDFVYCSRRSLPREL